MKLTDLKHDHSLTNLLKVIIFSILMLTPFFYIATKCLYVICNKNAYESYYGETINEINNKNIEVNNLQQGKYYLLLPNGKNDYVKITGNTEIVTRNVKLNGESKDIDALRFYVYNDNSYMSIQAIGNENFIVSTNNLNWTIEFDFYGENNTLYNSYIKDILYIQEVNNYSYLDNVFEYSINQMAQSQLFTWTQNTGVYTGANAMTTGLGLTSPVIPILISYWFLLTIIYVVIDIVIVCFTTITHMIVKKSN